MQILYNLHILSCPVKSLPQIHQASVLVCPSHRPEEKIKEKRKSFISTGCSVWEAQSILLCWKAQVAMASVEDQSQRWIESENNRKAAFSINTVGTVSRFNIQDSPTDNCPQIKNTYIRTEQIKPLWQFLQKLVAKLRATELKVDI